MKKMATLVTLLAVSACAHMSEKPSAFLQTVAFPNPAKPNELVIRLEQFTLDVANNCDTEQACAPLYRLEERAPYRELPVSSVRASGPELTVTLPAQPSDFKALFFVAKNLKGTPFVGCPQKLGYFPVQIKPQLLQLEIDDTERGEGLRSPLVVQYQSLTPVKVGSGQEEQRTRAVMSSSLSITDPADSDRRYSGYVESIGPLDKDGLVHTLTIRGAPRGKKLAIQVGGLETTAGQPQQASGAVQTLAVPKGRDDASFFLKFSAEANDVKNERKYTIDTRVHDVWRDSDRWEIGPTLDATFGNKTAKAPNSGALSADFRYFIPGTPSFRARLVVSPIFRTDRAFDNEDLGSDVALEGVIPELERTLDQRRKQEKSMCRSPLAIHWGWALRPTLALELGRHLKSSSAAVDGDEFARLRAGLALTLERERWKLAVSTQWRHLFSDEVLLQDGSVIETSRSDKGYVRADLSYDLGIVALTLSHLNGRQPPAFSSTHSTSLGLGFKF